MQTSKYLTLTPVLSYAIIRALSKNNILTWKYLFKNKGAPYTTSL
jgi:hypothetical protein